MYLIEEVLSIAIATVLGVVLIAFPTTVYRLQFFVYGADTGRRGRYGEPPEPSVQVKRLIRAIGVALLLFALYLVVSPWL